MIYKPYPYQQHATDHVISHPQSGLFLDMGLGKTVATLTAIDQLMNDYLDVSRVLVIAPLRVADQVWSEEISKWDHLKHLKISKVLGTEKQRKMALPPNTQADIYIINCENVPWLVAHFGGAFPFDFLVIDESSKFKSPKSQRFKALKIVRPLIKKVLILTGTPVPNGLTDLWSQLYLLDQGERLGKTITSYRDRYFTAGKRNGHVVYEYNLREGEDDLLGAGIYEKEIYDKISDICISMQQKDYLDLPELINRIIPVNLPPAVLDSYYEFEKKQVLAIADKEVTAVNAAALTNKLLQYANGAIYDETGAWHEVHKEKLETLEEILDTAAGHPVLVFYSYKHDLERILKYFKAYKPVVLKKNEDIEKWNARKIQLMCAHPASAGHGLNLQAGGNIIVWFGLTWSLENYQQGIKRLHRQGQTEVVINQSLCANNTMDWDVLQVLHEKAGSQDALLKAVKARIEKYTKVKL